MLNKKMLLSVFIIGCVATLAGAGTWASFSDAGNSTANTFTAGTLDMKLANNNDAFSDDVSATWTSPAGFKPGDVVQSTIKFTNVGSVDAKHIYFTFNNVAPAGGSGGVNLMNKIIVTNLEESFNGVLTGNQNVTLDADSRVGNNDGILTLAEFTQWAPGYFTEDDNDGIVIENGNKNDYVFIMDLKFADDAGNEYQGASCGFSMKTVATQNSPTDGMVKLH